MSLRIGWAFVWTFISLSTATIVAAEPANAPEAVPGNFLAIAEVQNRLIAQQLQTEVEQELRAAREQLATEPRAVQSRLKLLDERVRLATELSATTRSQLRARIEGMLRESSRLALEHDERTQARELNQAQSEEQQLMANRLVSDQQRTQQLIDRFNSLMLEQRYELASEVAGEIRALLPGTTQATSAQNKAASAQVFAAQAARLARADGLTKTLQQSEISAIPYADDVPLTYPQAEVWRELSQRRLARAKADLSSENAAEKRIRKALDETTSFEFDNTPLQDVVDALSDLHDIEIQIDVRSLEDSGLAPDLPVTRHLSGISLRSALKLMLGSLDLTYIVKNEVLTITTPEVAGADLVTRVYPVSDLVVPIPPLGFSGGFGGLGGTTNGPGSLLNGGGGQGNNFNFGNNNNQGNGIF